jgi:heme A synthase
VSLGRRYLAGVTLVAAAGAALVALMPADDRLRTAWGVVIGLVLQTPLGWWAVKSIP